MQPRAAVTEDTLALILGLIIFVLSLGPLFGVDVMGWVVSTSVWIDLAKALAPVSKSYAAVSGGSALLFTFLFLLTLLTLGALGLGISPRRFVPAFSVMFAISYLCWIAGSYANFAVTTPADLQKFGISWSLRLTNEGGYVIALLAGLLVGNLAPRLAAWLDAAIRPEWFIKIAIVILGGFLGATAAEKLQLAAALIFRGFAAIVEAYLIYWAVVYFVARKYFGFSREWAAPLASGISICGVSAAIATASAIRARPVVPGMVASLVVIFAVVELLFLPFIARAFLSHEPMVAGAWMGLAVKTDGAAVASGGITEALIMASAAARGVNYEKGWILATTTTVKIFIDVFIGVWAFILAYIWTRHINAERGDRASVIEIWQRFPKFILGYLITFGVIITLAVKGGPQFTPKIKSAMAEANSLRGVFFVMTFFTIGVMSNFRKLWAEGIAKLAAVYVISLFGFVIWVGLVISYIFFGGGEPPRVAG